MGMVLERVGVQEQRLKSHLCRSGTILATQRQGQRGDTENGLPTYVTVQTIKTANLSTSPTLGALAPIFNPMASANME